MADQRVLPYCSTGMRIKSALLAACRLALTSLSPGVIRIFPWTTIFVRSKETWQLDFLVDIATKCSAGCWLRSEQNMRRLPGGRSRSWIRTIPERVRGTEESKPMELAVREEDQTDGI